MNIKEMLIEKAIESAKKMADEQADNVEGMLIEYIQSEEVEKKLAEKMDKAINIPFVSDQKEEPMFREFADILTDVVAGAVKMVKSKV
jgi:hypothetical protein|tara:strand:+ start:498 stop:761 length:264 start_codon:yes stop_codon:yes gene_type:complete